MSKRKFDNLYARLSKKRQGKEDKEGEFITVQRLSSSVEGKAQKYSRIGALTMVAREGKERTMDNIKKACLRHFGVDSQKYDCDLVAGERGPSYVSIAQITNWKVLHVRFVETRAGKTTETLFKSEDNGTKVNSNDYRNFSASTASLVALSMIKPPPMPKGLKDHNKSHAPVTTPAPPSESLVKSISISEMIKLGKLVPPKQSKELVTLQVESFDTEKGQWSDAFDVRLSLDKDKFATGGCRDAFKCTGINGLEGKLVLKRYREDKVQDIISLFGSVESHTRKVVQMHALARYFAKRLREELPMDYGKAFMYTKLYFGRLNDDFVTLESFIEGTFTKYINNTGDIILKDSEVAKKAEAFVHYTYILSGKELMVLDIQGVEYWLCDLEIASTKLFDANKAVYFCSGNLSGLAIETFLQQHQCNNYCYQLNLDINEKIKE